MSRVSWARAVGRLRGHTRARGLTCVRPHRGETRPPPQANGRVSAPSRCHSAGADRGTEPKLPDALPRLPEVGHCASASEDGADVLALQPDEGGDAGPGEVEEAVEGIAVERSPFGRALHLDEPPV